MPRLARYRETELMIVLCIICHEEVTKKGIPVHRKKEHNIGKGGKLSDHWIEATQEMADAREFVRIKSVADPNKYLDLGIQITTKAQKTSSKWFTLSEVLKKPQWLGALRLFLDNKIKIGAKSTLWSRTVGKMYQKFIQLREIAEEFFQPEMEGLECPICNEVIDNIGDLRIFLQDKGENNYDFCNNDPSSSHYVCNACVKKNRKLNPQYGKCHYNCGTGLYL